MIDFKKKIGIFGFGVEGKSLYQWMKKHGAEHIFVFDEKEQDQDTGSHFSNFSKLTECDIIFRSPGIRPEKIQNLINAQCKNSSFPKAPEITSSTEYFFKNSPTRNIIGVTGTKGKGTTATLIFEILKTAQKHVFLGGNIGTPIFDFFDEITAESWVVLELSSFQLFDTDFSPPYAVLLRTDSEHLDWHTNVEEYRFSKQNLFRFQCSADTLVVFGESDICFEMAKVSSAKKIWICPNISAGNSSEMTIKKGKVMLDTHEIFPISSIRLRGKFHYENVLSAVAIAKTIGISNTHIQSTIENFYGLPMRCEMEAEKNGIQFFNDSFSTIPETTIASLSIFGTPVYLIVGGSEKYSDFTTLAYECARHPYLKKILLIGETAPRILEALQHQKSQIPTVLFPSPGFPKGQGGEQVLLEVFKIIKKEALSGENVLFSPACASFDLFENYKKRGKIFNEYVRLFPSL